MSTRQNVAIIYFGYINSVNGVTNIIHKIFDHKASFDASQINLTLFSLSQKGSNGEFIKKKIHNINKERFIKKYKILSIIFIMYRFFFNAYRSVRKFNKSKDTYDTILFHDIFSCTLYFLSNRKRRRVILFLHTNGNLTEMICQSFPKIKGTLFEKMLLRVFLKVVRKVDMLGFVSNYSKAQFLKEYKINIDPIVIYNGVEDLITNEKVKDQNSLILTCVGTVCYRKGHDILVSSMKKLLSSGITNIFLNIIGNGPLLIELENLLTDNEKKFINFLGERSDVNNYLCASDCFILMSRDEGLPFSIIEGMQAKLPIIASNVGGIPEMIEDDNGWLIENGESQLIELLQELSVNKNILKNKGVSSYRMFIEKFNINSMIENYCRLLKGE